jgi:hypothetical protein
MKPLFSLRPVDQAESAVDRLNHQAIEQLISSAANDPGAPEDGSCALPDPMSRRSACLAWAEIARHALDDTVESAGQTGLQTGTMD